MSTPFIDTSSCQETFHWFQRTDKGVKAFHADDNECSTSEFRLPLKQETTGTHCKECGGSSLTDTCHFCRNRTMIQDLGESIMIARQRKNA